MVNESFWHYTDVNALPHIFAVAGVAGRTEEVQLRATSFRYLNDSREVRHAFDAMSDVVRLAKATAYSDPDQKKFIQEAQQEELNFYEMSMGGAEKGVLCFTSLRDSLSQWRAYGGSTGGAPVAIGFDPAALQAIGCKQITYQSAGAAANYLRARLLPVKLSKDWRRPGISIREQVVTSLAEEAIFMKHEGFREEAEWRIAIDLDVNGCDFRVNNYGIVPYESLNISLDVVLEIMVGPTPHQELVQRSLQQWVASSFATPVEVSVSSVPFRNW